MRAVALAAALGASLARAQSQFLVNELSFGYAGKCVSQTPEAEAAR